MRLPLCLPRKVTTVCESAHGTTTRAQSRQALAAATQILRACAVEMHVDDFERHECTVNSSELAGHARAAERFKHSCLTTTVRTPKCVHSSWALPTFLSRSRMTSQHKSKDFPRLCFPSAVWVGVICSACRGGLDMRLEEYQSGQKTISVPCTSGQFKPSQHITEGFNRWWTPKPPLTSQPAANPLSK